ncbi:aminotransferase class I/II-fold pyridoxal phosphate-dependent enzyme [Bythopirellula goksoeyrii]|nr:pyridoxal phosphate-dependent aminotransferase family protein [Bythopirellula goksoeyrii]
MQSPPGPETKVDDCQYLYFCGTGYLGLHGHADLIQASIEATRAYGLGTATSRSGYGNAPPIIEVEELAARFWDSEAAYYFASGYLGNHVVLSVLAKPGSVFLLDENSHYSVVDACRCFDLPTYQFAHLEAEALRELLKDRLRPGQVPIVLSDGVFASSGAIAPVKEYLDVLEDIEGAMLCLDDCHAFGVLGERGCGTFEHHGIPQRGINELPPNQDIAGSPRLFAVGTLSKAFGGYGGIIAGTNTFIESARSSSHYYSGASAPPIPVAAASAMALKLVANTPNLVAGVKQNALRLKQGLNDLGLEIELTPVPIVSLELGDSQNMRRIQHGLAEEGILIDYKSEYAGLGARGALRIAVFATHTEEMIKKLTEAFGRHL